MAGKKLQYEIGVDASDAVSEFKKVGKAATEAGKAIEKGLEVSPDSGKVDKFISNLKKAGVEAKNVAKAVESVKKFAPTVDDSEIANLVLSLRKAGAGFDEIEGKAKELGDTLKELDAPEIKNLDASLKTAKTGTDDLTDSARGANSAMANMVGNAAQDLGALSGVAGSAGVAIGQMAEYAADARLAGEGLGSALGSMAKVAVPIAGIAIATQLVGKAMQAANEQSKIQAELVDNATKAWAEYLGLTDELQASLDEVGESTSFVSEAMTQLGLSLFKGLQEGENATEDLAETNQALLDLGLATADTTPIDFFRALGEQFTILGRTKDSLSGIDDLVSQVELVTQGITDFHPNPQVWDEVSVAVSGLSDSFAAAAPAAAAYADQIAYAISTGENEEQIVMALADALVASGKATVANARATAQGIFDANETIITSYENLDDTLDDSALENFATKTLEQAASSSLELAAAIARIRAENPDASEFDVWLKLQQYLEDSGFAMRDFQQQVRLLNFDAMDSDQFADLVADVKDGAVDLANFEEVVAGLAASWGISEEAVRQYVLQEADKQLNEEGKAAEETAVSVTDLAEAYAKIKEILAETPDLAGALESELNKIDSLLGGLEFDVNFAKSWDEALDGLKGFGPDLQSVADNWAAILRGDDIEIFGNVRADDPEFMKRWNAALTLFQEGAVNAFEQGGTSAAQAFVDAQVAEIQARNPELSLVDIYRIMGLPDDGSIQTLIQPTIDADNAAKAAAILDVLAGTGSADPRIAQIQVALITGEMTPEEALAASMQAYQDWLDDNPVTVPTTADTEGADGEVAGWRKNVEKEPAVVDLDADPAAAETTTKSFTDKPRTAGINLSILQLLIAEALLNAVARDRDAEIWTKLPNYTETERQLERLARNRDANIIVRTVQTGGGGGAPTVGGRAAPAMAPAAAGLMAADGDVATLAAPAPMTTLAATPLRVEVINQTPIPTPNITVQAAVIGNPHEVDRAVSKALRRHQRLNGTRR